MAIVLQNNVFDGNIGKFCRDYTGTIFHTYIKANNKKYIEASYFT